MMGSIKEIDFSEMSEAVPAFLTMVMMPLTYSIATGIGLGLISYTLIKLFTGKIKDLSILTVVVAILFVIKFIL
jgi:AGZA family xanthine/uracil permease-like MFS transporter